MESNMGGITKLVRPELPSYDDDSYDSLDEEEEYYQQYYHNQDDGSGDEEDDETLQLTDIVRPLQAWDFYVTGKLVVGHDGWDSDADKSQQQQGDDEDDTNSLDEKALLREDGDVHNESSHAAAAQEDDHTGSPGRSSQSQPPMTPIKVVD